MPIRTGGDADWTTFITGVGDGSLPHVSPNTGRPLPNQPALQRRGGTHWIAIPQHLLRNEGHGGMRVTFDAHVLRANVHPSVELQQAEHARQASTRAIVSPHNDTAAAHNAHFLMELSNDLHKLFAAESLPSDAVAAGAIESAFMSPEFMRRLHQPGVPSHCLHLKVGALVMLMRNLSPATRALNGVRLRVLRITRSLISACHNNIDDPRAEDVLHIPRIQFEISIPKSALKVTRLQFPLQLAYAITANKGSNNTRCSTCSTCTSDTITNHSHQSQSHWHSHTAATRTCAHTS